MGGTRRGQGSTAKQPRPALAWRCERVKAFSEDWEAKCLGAHRQGVKTGGERGRTLD